jgi:uncharacterized protein
MPEVEDFTEAERVRIRQALFRYAETYKLGMIALAKRISKANPFEPDVNHRTVERFLKNQHETNPLLVKWCKVFLQKVTPDPAKEMAEGLLWFYGPSDPRGWAGQYHVWFGEAGYHRSPDAIADIADDVGFFRVRMESKKDQLIYDGVLLASGSAVSMFLKNRLTGWPCVCLLSLEFAAFSGTIIETTHENTERIAKMYMAEISYLKQGYAFRFRRPIEIVPAWDEQFAIAYAGKVREIEEWIAHHPGVAIDTFEQTTGLTLLHIAIGRNNLELTRFLLANGATIMPDQRGRWPSLIAAACGVSDELYDLVADAELDTEEKPQDV